MECLLFLATLILLAILVLNVIRATKQHKTALNLTDFIILFPVLTIAPLISLLLYPVFSVYRSIVSVVLKIKLGKKFYGLLEGQDALTAIDNVRNSMIGILLVVETNNLNSRGELLERVREFVEENVLSKLYWSKLRTTLRSFGGYYYLENINITTQECVQKLPLMDDDIDIDVLQKMLARGQYSQFNGSMLWDVLVGTQPLQKNTDDNSALRYPIMIRVHHLIADGVTLVQVLNSLGDKTDTNLDNFVPRATTQLLPILQQIKDILNVIVYFPITLYTIFKKIKNSNELHGKLPTNEERLAIRFDENGSYFQKVKNIRKYTKATIPEIILTAFCESLREHFIKYKKGCPKELTTMIPLVQSTDDLRQIQSKNIQEIKLRNKFVAIALQVPLCTNIEKDANLSLYEKLKLVRILSNDIKTSTEFQLGYIIFHILAPMFPIPVIKLLPHVLHATSLVSLLPGISKKSLCNGKGIVTDCIFWPPHLVGLGILFSSFSYDNRLIISINCDAVYMSQEQIGEILDKFYRTVDLLEEEVKNIHN